jgi:CelD/BcsL family acetyltransferase involved in cellulose biosynthesis
VEECLGVDAFRAAQTEWSALLHRLPGPLPFQTPAWSQAWVGCFGVRHLLRQDEPLLLRVTQGPRLVALAPMVRTRYRLWPLGPALVFDRPVGADPNLTELRVPLIEPGFEAAVAQALVQRTRQVWGWHKLELPAAALEAALAPLEPARVHRHRLTPMFWLTLPDSWETFRAGLKRNIKESLRRCYNSLAREGKTPRLEVVSGAAAIESLLPLFWQLHSQRSQRPDTVPHPDYFALPRHRAFLQALLQQAEADATLQPLMFVLWVDQERVALRLGFRTPGSLYLYYSGYEHRWAPYSVMTTLVAEVLQWALGQGLRHVNLSVGRDVSKTRWSPQEQDFAEVLLTGGRGLKATLLRQATARVWRQTQRP